MLQLPVLNLGLPMAASTQLADFFHCGGSTGILKASHYECENEAAGETEFCGHCVRRNLEANLPPFSECGGYQVFAQMDGPCDGAEQCPWCRRGGARPP